MIWNKSQKYKYTELVQYKNAVAIPQNIFECYTNIIYSM
jgi:hypothetical protein